MALRAFRTTFLCALDKDEIPNEDPITGAECEIAEPTLEAVKTFLREVLHLQIDDEDAEADPVGLLSVEVAIEDLVELPAEEVAKLYRRTVDALTVSNEPFGGAHAPDCPYRMKGECNCWRSDPVQNRELAEELDSVEKADQAEQIRKFSPPSIDPLADSPQSFREALRWCQRVFGATADTRLAIIERAEQMLAEARKDLQHP